MRNLINDSERESISIGEKVMVAREKHLEKVLGRNIGKGIVPADYTTKLVLNLEDSIYSPRVLELIGFTYEIIYYVEFGYRENPRTISQTYLNREHLWGNPLNERGREFLSYMKEKVSAEVEVVLQTLKDEKVSTALFTYYVHYQDFYNPPVANIEFTEQIKNDI